MIESNDCKGKHFPVRRQANPKKIAERPHIKKNKEKNKPNPCMLNHFALSLRYNKNLKHRTESRTPLPNHKHQYFLVSSAKNGEWHSLTKNTSLWQQCPYQSLCPSIMALSISRNVWKAYFANHSKALIGS